MKHYGDNDGLKVLSYNAIITEILTNRNYGKTWAFKKRAVRRAMKHGKKTIWLRMFETEKKECITSFYNSADLQRYCNVSIYDPQYNKNGNIKQIGNTIYFRKKIKGKWTKWKWFLKVYKLSDADAIRSADDVDVDTIVFDEFTKPPHRYNLFRGDIATALSDILFTLKREHEVRIIVTGNKESLSNPINDYFKIPTLPTKYEGIRRFKKGAFVVQQINNKPDNTTNYSKSLFNLFKGTPYGNYIYDDAYKNQKGVKVAKTPHGASIYCQVYIEGKAFKISASNDLFYVNKNIDTTRRVFCDVPPNKWAREQQLVRRYRRYFDALVCAIADGRIYFDNAVTAESFLTFYKWLSI